MIDHNSHIEQESTHSFYERLYRSLYQRLLQYGLSVCDAPQVVEDAVQELFEYFLKHKDALDGIDDIQAYLSTSLRHRIFKKISERKHIDAINEIHRSYVSTHAEYRMIEEETIILRQKQINDALARLPVGESNVLKARFLEEKSYDTIAKENNSTKRTVYNQVHSGIQKMKSLF